MKQKGEVQKVLVRVSGKFSSHYFTSVRVATMRSTIKSSFFNLTLHDQLSMYTYSQFSALLLTILIQVKQIWETTVINDIRSTTCVMVLWLEGF